MGYIRHHAIVVTGSYGDTLEQAHAKATALNMQVTNIVDGVTNGYRSFMCGPDGSKEGWDTSKAGDVRRAEFIEWLTALEEAEGRSSPLCWVEIQYGDDDLDTHVVDSSDDRVAEYYNEEKS